MKNPVRSLFRILAAAALAAGLAANALAVEMTVSAAASLTDAFGEIKALFEKAHPGLHVNTNFAASNPLLKQLEEGAPADVFASADQQTMDKAVAAGVVDAATRRDFARNELVLIVPKGAKKPASLAELKGMERIAIGNPDSVPAGRYTREALRAAGLWEVLLPECVQAASVRQALAYVARGEADAGFVYRTDALQMGDRVDIALVVGGHEPVLYPVAVATTGANPQAGQEFIDFVLSPEGQQVLARYGFSRP